MFDRPSFDPRYSPGLQAGGSNARPGRSNGIPAMFLPNYTGDGQGTPRIMSAAVNGQAFKEQQADDTLPMWSGDGRRNIVNPLMPVFHSGGARPASMSAPSPATAGRALPPQALPVSGDGQGKVALSPELTMQVNAQPAAPAITKNKPRKQRRADKGPEVRAERSETWKLVTLVVIFLIWISTASTLLFLYMDRYLFP
jgi:hypothetical protein